MLYENDAYPGWTTSFSLTRSFLTRPNLVARSFFSGSAASSSSGVALRYNNNTLPAATIVSGRTLHFSILPGCPSNGNGTSIAAMTAVPRASVTPRERSWCSRPSRSRLLTSIAVAFFARETRQRNVCKHDCDVVHVSIDRNARGAQGREKTRAGVTPLVSLCSKPTRNHERNVGKTIAINILSSKGLLSFFFSLYLLPIKISFLECTFVAVVTYILASMCTHMSISYFEIIIRRFSHRSEIYKFVLYEDKESTVSK